MYQKCFYAVFGLFVCTHKKKKMRGDVFTKALNKSVQKIKPQSSLPSDELLLEMILLLNERLMVGAKTLRGVYSYTVQLIRRGAFCDPFVAWSPGAFAGFTTTLTVITNM